jgi:hypothetical protein
MHQMKSKQLAAIYNGFITADQASSLNLVGSSILICQQIPEASTQFGQSNPCFNHLSEKLCQAPAKSKKRALFPRCLGFMFTFCLSTQKISNLMVDSFKL